MIASKSSKANVSTLLRQHRAELVAFVARRAAERVSPEDVVQIAAVRAIAGAEQLRDTNAGRAWLFQITRRVLAEQLRRPEAVLRSAVAVSDTTAGSVAAFACDCVLANLRKLRPEHALVLHRVAVDGASLAEVAEELGISVNAMTVRVYRAREALKQRLQTHCGTDSLRACIDCLCTERGCCAEERT